MKKIIACGCDNKIEFEKEEGKNKKVICEKCGATFISSDNGYKFSKLE